MTSHILNLKIAPQGNQRLGLHVTSDELAIWQNRAVNGPYKTAGDVSTNSPGDWTRVAANAATFTGDPDAENVKGLGPDCDINTAVTKCPTPQPCGEIFSRDGLSVNDRTNVGVYMRDAAFYCLIKGPGDSTANTYFSQIVTRLLNQAGEAGMDPTNSTHWDYTANNTNDGSPFFVTAIFLTRWLLTYDYLKAAVTNWGTWSISSTDRTTLDTWFINWATWFKNLEVTNDKPYGPSGAFTNPTSEPHTISGTFTTIYNQGFHTAIWNNGSDGPQPTNIQWWNNRHNEMWRFIGLTAIVMNSSTLLTPAKVWFRDWIKYAHFTNADLTEMDRANDDNNGAAGLNYASASLSTMICFADALARNGDTSLLDYSTPAGDQGYGANVAGTGKTLLAAAQNIVNYAGTNLFSPKRTCKNAADNGEDLNFSVNGFNGVGDVYMAPGNLYWQDATIQDTYLRTRTGATGYPATPGGVGGDPGISAWCGGSSVYPGLLFMYGNNEGLVDPYNV